MIHGLIPSLAEGGKIKIGGLGDKRKSQKGDAYRLPVKYDYFVLTGTRRKNDDPLEDLEIDTDLMNALAEKYADSDGRIRTIPIVLHSDAIEDVFPYCYAAYSGKRLACRGDGQQAERREVRSGVYTGKTKTVDCPCPLLESKRCKPHGVLHCSISLPDQAVAGAVHRWRTTSEISIKQMVGSLTQILATVGVLQGLPLVLRVMPIRVAPEGVATTVHCCHVELRAKDLQSVQQQALQLAQLRNTLRAELEGPRRAYKAMLQAPGYEPEGEAAEIEAEFYSEAEDRPRQTAASRRADAFRQPPTDTGDSAPIDTIAEPVEAHLEQLHDTVQAELTELAEQEQVPPPHPAPPPIGAPSWYDQAVAIAAEIGINEKGMLKAAASIGINKSPEEWSEQDMNGVIAKLEE